MNLKSLSILPLIVFIFLICACGGGGGGASTDNSQDNSKQDTSFFSVRYKESTVNDPTVSTDYSTTVDSSGLSGSLDGDAVFKGGAKASATDFSPEFLLYLQLGTQSAVPSAKYNAVVYGLHSSQVTVGLYSLDFSTDASPDVTQLGVTNVNSVSMLSTLPSASEVSVDQGKVTWGAWKGAIDSDANTILLSRDRLFLLASRVDSHSVSEVEGKTFSPTISIMQNSSDSDSSQLTVASGKGPVSFSSTSVGPTTEFEFSQTNQNVNITTGVARPYRLNSGDSSLLEISDSSAFTSLTEYGFLGKTNFHVIINPDNVQRPSLLVIFN